MSDAAKLFVLDANVFMADYYAPDLCPGFLDCLSHYGRLGQVISINRVKKEILYPPELVEWGKRESGLFVSSAEKPTVEAFEEMMNWVKNKKNPQFKDTAKAKFAKAADGWLAAYAKVHNAVVVTNEALSPKAENRVPLPNVCKEFGVSYQNTFQMLRDLKVQFEWSIP